jgi:CheY-like chemotaxis protein
MINANNYSVLLVEDDSNDVLFVQRAFRRVNSAISVNTVKDGEAAVDYLVGVGDYANRDRYPLPAMILLDLKLPRRSGIEVLQWIRSREAIKRIPVVVLTSSRERIDVDRSYDVGVNSYLVKPVNFDVLSEMIHAINSYWLSLNEYPSVLTAN